VRTELCVYCNLRPGTTWDHVPAKGLYPPPRPHNLIKVPCCEPCQRATPKDDEYFRFILASRWEVGDSPSARACWPALHRSLRKPEAAGFRQLILSKTSEADVMTPAGLHLGRRMIFEVDPLRVEKVLGRTVWGLFYHHFKPQRLPDDYAVAVLDVAQLLEIRKPDEVARVVTPLLHAEEHVIGGDVFAYRFQVAPEQPNTTTWMLRFYGAVEFLAITVPRASAPRPMVHGLQARP